MALATPRRQARRQARRAAARNINEGKQTRFAKINYGWIQPIHPWDHPLPLPRPQSGTS